MTDEQPMDNWKQFHGTELGGLMSKLYSNQNRPKINYPKSRSKQTYVPAGNFIATGSKAEAVDPRKATKRFVDVAVPKNFKKSDREVHRIDLIDRRRGSDQMREEMEDIKMRLAHYRPAHTQSSSSEAEKERLNQIFQYKGGKGLPDELTHPIGETPLERAEKQKEADRMHSLKVKRGLIPKQSTAPRKLSEKEEMMQQIQEEIEERVRHLEDMNQLGVKSHSVHTIKAEISRKVLELKRLEQDS